MSWRVHDLGVQQGHRAGEAPEQSLNGRTPHSGLDDADGRTSHARAGRPVRDPPGPWRVARAPRVPRRTPLSLGHGPQAAALHLPRPPDRAPPGPRGAESAPGQPDLASGCIAVPACSPRLTRRRGELGCRVAPDDRRIRVRSAPTASCAVGRRLPRRSSPRPRVGSRGLERSTDREAVASRRVSASTTRQARGQSASHEPEPLLARCAEQVDAGCARMVCADPAPPWWWSSARRRQYDVQKVCRARWRAPRSRSGLSRSAASDGVVFPAPKPPATRILMATGGVEPALG
jgi:hypothetical protein